MAEVGVVAEADIQRVPGVLDQAKDLQDRGGAPDVVTGVENLQHRLSNALSLSIDNRDQTVRPDREETVNTLLAGFNRLLEDPHKQGKAAESDVVDTQEAERLAGFIRLVNQLGSLNPDGSVNLNFRHKNSPSGTTNITIPKR